MEWDGGRSQGRKEKVGVSSNVDSFESFSYICINAACSAVVGKSEMQRGKERKRERERRKERKGETLEEREKDL